MPSLHSLKRQSGLTLVEFMVSIAIGMLMIAALATLIANQSTTRSDIDKSGKMIENGRYAIQTMASDIQLAGYWGELSTLDAVPTSLPDPCSVVAADIEAAMPLHIQGYNNPAPLALSCVTNHMAGTDVLVVRRVDPSTSDMETGGVIDLARLKTGQTYLQTGLSALNFAKVFRQADGSTDAAAFTLLKRNGTPANIRKVLVNIYYVSTCSVCTGGSADTTPTLKRVELGVSGTAAAFLPAVTLAEGIENLQIDYGVDTAGNGTPVGADVATVAAAVWADVMTVKINILARSTETTVGHQDTKSYSLGSTGGTVGPLNDGYKRHAFTQSVRLVNPSSRRAL